MLPPCLIFLDGDGPADPLVARERRYVFPSRQCLRVGRERLSEIGRKIMYDSSGDLNGCHRAIRRLKDQASDTRVNSDFGTIAYPNIISIFEFCPASGATPSIMAGAIPYCRESRVKRN